MEAFSQFTLSVESFLVMSSSSVGPLCWMRGWGGRGTLKRLLPCSAPVLWQQQRKGRQQSMEQMCRDKGTGRMLGTWNTQEV